MPQRTDPQALFAESLTQVLERYRESIDRASEQLTSEAVHDVRVASRRLMAGLDAVHSLLRSRKAARIRRKLKKGLDSLGPLRDVDVQLKLAQAEMKSAAMKVFAGKQEDKKKRLKRSGPDNLSRIKPRKWEKPVAAFGRKIGRPLPRMDPGHFLFTLNSIVDLTFASVVDETQAVELRKPQTFHHLRVRLKNFRYLLEFVAPVLQITDAQIERIKRHQDALGEIHDLMVFVGKLERFFGRRDRTTPDSVAVLRRLKDRLDSRLHIFMGNAETVLDLWPSVSLRVNSEVLKTTDDRITGTIESIAGFHRTA